MIKPIDLIKDWPSMQQGHNTSLMKAFLDNCIIAYKETYKMHYILIIDTSSKPKAYEILKGLYSMKYGYAAEINLIQGIQYIVNHTDSVIVKKETFEKLKLKTIAEKI